MAENEDLDASALAANRWIWAASSVQKMPGGLQKVLGGQWNPRYLVLGAHTGCLHWFRDEGPGAILGQERGHLRLANVSKIESVIDDEPDTKRLLLWDLLGNSALTIRASSEVVEAWKKALLAAKTYKPTFVEGMFTSHGWVDASYSQLVEPPEPLDVDSCIEYDDSRLPLMGFAFESQEKAGSPLQCFALGGPKLRFLVICRGRLLRFEPREFALLGEAKGGEVVLASLKTVARHNQYVIADQARLRLIFKTANAQTWAACLRNADAFHCSSPSAQDDASKKAGSQRYRLVRVVQCVGTWIKQRALLLLLCNSVVALTLLLQDSSAFWPFVMVLNLLTCLRAGADIPQPPVSETAGREDEVDLMTSLHPVALGSTAGCVEDAKADSILVRSQGYSTHKQKEASQASMYELRRAFTMPAPSSSSRHSHVARLGLEMLGLEGPISSDLPTFCIVNLQIPDDAPNILQGADAKCSSAIFCFAVRSEVESALNESQEPALLLLRRFCQLAQEDNMMRNKLKALCQITESKNSSLPSVLQNLSGKPALLGKSAKIYSGAGYIEVDVDISSCAYVNRLSLHQMRSRLSSLQLDFALIIQGDSDAELPERVWAASTLHFVDMDELIHTPRSVSPSPLQKSPETASLQKRPPVSFFE